VVIGIDQTIRSIWDEILKGKAEIMFDEQKAVVFHMPENEQVT